MWVALDGGPEAIGIGDAGLVHEHQSRIERREVGEHEGGSVIGRQRLLEPGLPVGVEQAVVAAGQARVQPDEAHRVPVDHVTAVVDGHVDGEQVGEGQSESRPLVVVTGERDDPFGDGGQRVTEGGVLGWRAVIGQVARGQDHVGCGFEGQQMVDHLAECFGGVDESAEVTVVVPDVAVRYLGDQHGVRLGDERVRGGWWKDRGTMGSTEESGSMELAGGRPGPTQRSYWVIDGRLAAGAYPGKAGRGPLERVPEVLQQLLDAGVDTFVNLTQDDPARHPFGSDLHLTPYREAVVGRAEVLAHPIPDVDIPDGGPAEMVGILDAIDAALAAGRTAYVHCWGGVGRTGTVVGCWLVRHGLAASDEVLAAVADLRRGDVGAGDRMSPETTAQVDFVKAWEAGR